MRNMVSKNVGKPTILHCHFPTFYDRHLQLKNYNDEVILVKSKQITSESGLTDDATKIKWTSELKKTAMKGTQLDYHSEKMRLGLYRPFTKKWLYYDKPLIHRIGHYVAEFGDSNKVILTTGKGTSREFSNIATDLTPDVQLLMNCQAFMRYNNEVQEDALFQTGRDNVSETFANKLGLSTDDTYAYVYGVLNSPEYQSRYANDLKKDLARIPVLKNIEQYVAIGKQLMDLHINYEDAPIYDGCEVVFKAKKPSYKVKQIRFKSRDDHSEIKFNSDITIKNIPNRVYDYVVNGRSAIEWILDQYQVKTDKASQITDDPNDYSEDPKYIFNLLLRIITVSLRTLDLVAQLPRFEVAE